MIGEGIRLTEVRLREMVDSPADVYDMIKSGDEPEISLDKAWDAIRFLLRRLHPEDALAEFLIEGGVPVGDDLGYGPGQGYFSSDVAAIASLLAKTSGNDLRDAFDGDELTKARIYPRIWDRDPKVEDVLGFVVDDFNELKRFVSEAHSANEALLFWIS